MPNSVIVVVVFTIVAIFLLRSAPHWRWSRWVETTASLTAKVAISLQMVGCIAALGAEGGGREVMVLAIHLRVKGGGLRCEKGRRGYVLPFRRTPHFRNLPCCPTFTAAIAFIRALKRNARWPGASQL